MTKQTLVSEKRKNIAEMNRRLSKSLEFFSISIINYSVSSMVISLPEADIFFFKPII